MKANKVPKKIYINPMPNPSDGYVGVAWSEPHIDMKEYIRTDAFIDKACEYFRAKKKCVFACIGEDVYKSLLNKEEIEDFKNYMKGE